MFFLNARILSADNNASSDTNKIAKCIYKKAILLISVGKIKSQQIITSINQQIVYLTK